MNRYRTRVVRFGIGWTIERFQFEQWCRVTRFTWKTRQAARNMQYWYAQ